MQKRTKQKSNVLGSVNTFRGSDARKATRVSVLHSVSLSSIAFPAVESKHRDSVSVFHVYVRLQTPFNYRHPCCKHQLTDFRGSRYKHHAIGYLPILIPFNSLLSRRSYANLRGGRNKIVI
jgi:hypothetical protein